MNYFKILLLFFLYCKIGFSQSIPLSEVYKHNNSKTNLTKFLNEKTWNNLFPNRFGIGLKDTVNKIEDFYSFKAFVAAAKLFPAFLSTGNDTLQRRELAAFLANTALETSGGWATAPGGYFKWGFYFLEENNVENLNSYSDTANKNYPPVQGKYYFGRGPEQLSWNYNYGQFSEAWFGNKDSLLQHPDYLSKYPALSFASAIWFWMTEQFPKPSCHNIIVDKWIPSANDSLKGRLPGFGAIVNVINGGVECGVDILSEKINYRYQYYLYFCKYFGVQPGNNFSCKNQMPFGK